MLKPYRFEFLHNGYQVYRGVQKLTLPKSDAVIGGTTLYPTGRPRGGPAGRHVRGEGVRDDLVSLEYWCALLHTKSCTLPSQCIRKRLTRSSSLVSLVWARSVLVAAKVSLSLVNGA